MLGDDQSPQPMLRNYFRVAFRNLRRSPLYATVNVVGLAVGLACCAFILLYIVDELSYERFHEQADRIVRIAENQQDGDQERRLAQTYGPLAPALREDIPGIEEAVRFMPYSMLVAPHPGDAESPSQTASVRFQEDRFTFVDSTFLDVFTFDVLRGDPTTALDAPYSVVLTASAADRYFGSADPIQQTILVRDDEEDAYTFTVTGVIEDPPHSTHLQFDLLASFSSIRGIYGNWVDDPRNWEHPPLYTYALLRPDFSVDDLRSRLPEFAARRMGADRTRTRSLAVEELTRIRLHSDRENDIAPGGDIRYVYLFASIGLLILFVAGINFVNLATARASSRASEVGIRKAIGARRGQLVRQFLGEAGMTVLGAALLASVLVFTLLPLFNALSGKSLTLGVFASGWVLAGFVGVCLLVWGGAGTYPAFRLSSLEPSAALKGNAALGGPSRLREFLLIVQFAVSIGLLIATAVIFRQLGFMQNERLGFDKEHVVIVPLRDMEAQMQSAALLSEWEQLPGVRSATVSSGMPGLAAGLHDFWLHAEGSAGDSVSLPVLTVDPMYAETYGLEIVDGRDFSDDRPADAEDAFLLNESAARRLGWTDPVGRQLRLTYYHYGEKVKRGSVVGVVKDFQYGSLRRDIEPIVFHVLPESYYYDYASARIDPTSISQTIADMKGVWDIFAPNRPFEPRFLDDQFDMLYRAEERLGRLSGIFAFLAVLTACLGLFGLSGQLTQQRAKEIGIRKVLGASIAGIALLISKDFARLVLLAFVVAAPVCYVFMHRWLESFADRISVGPGIFAVALAATMVPALLTVSYHAVRSALRDPVESLRSD